MDFILQYLWGLCVIVSALNSLMLKFNMRKTDSAEERAEQRKVVIVDFLIFAITCMLLQVFQILGNYHTPLYILYRDFSNLFYWLGVGTLFLCYITILLNIIFFKNIEEYSIQLFRVDMKRKTMILFVGGIMIFAVLVVFVFSSFLNIKEIISIA